MTEKLHIAGHVYEIKTEQREKANGNKSACVWFTGLSASGKSTLANQVEQELFSKGIKSFNLDGDNIRKGLNAGLGFTKEDRHENLRRIGEVVRLMCDAGLVVVAAFISPFIAEREMLKTIIGNAYIEVFVDTPIDVCEQRDFKGLYKKAKAGEITNFTGISSPYEIPVDPDIHIKTTENTQEESLQMVLDILIPKIQLSS